MKSTFSILLVLLHTVVASAQWGLSLNSITPSFYTRSVAWDGKIYFAGGLTGGTTANNKVEILDLATGTKTSKTLPVGRGAIMCVAHAGKIYFAGGFKFLSPTSVQTYANVDIYDVQTGTWTAHELSLARAGGGAVAVGGKILFLGGHTSVNSQLVPTDVVDVYDPATNTWETAKLPEPKGFFQPVVIGNQVYCPGGILDQYALTTTKYVDIYHTDTQNWARDSLSLSRGAAAAVAVGKYLVVAGGLSAATGATDAVDIWNLETGEKTTAKLSAPRTHIAAAKLGPRAYFTGGGGVDVANASFNASSAAVDAFDANTGQWSTQTLKQNRVEHACAAWGNKIAVGGGWRPEQGQLTGSVETLTDLTFVSAPALALAENPLALYPNPTSNVLYVDILDPNMANGAVDLRLFDSIGRLVAQKIGESANGHGFVKVGMLEPGTYFLETSINERQYATQLVFIRRD